MWTFNNGWKTYLLVGAGLAAGTLGILALTRKNNCAVRRACVSLLSHGLDIKDKIVVAAETTKESLEDVVAEARYESAARKMDAAVTSSEDEVAQPETTAKPKLVKKTAAKRSTNKTASKPA